MTSPRKNESAALAAAALRRWVRKAVVFDLRFLPDSLVLRVMRTWPIIAPYIPVGIRGIHRGYLGAFTVLIDTTYPIERRMLLDAYERQILKVIAAHVKQAAVCIDVGANVGAIAFALAKQATPRGRVYAFEPGPPTYERLVRNIAMNPAYSQTIVPVRLGLSDRPGYLGWNEEPHNRGNARLLHEGSTRVEVTTLDAYCRANGVDHVDFIKVDVEGMEYEVFKGAAVILARCQPILLFETLAPFKAIRGFDIFAAIETLLNTHGYVLFRIEDDGSMRRTTSADLSANTLAVPAARLQAAKLDVAAARSVHQGAPELGGAP